MRTTIPKFVSASMILAVVLTPLQGFSMPLKPFRDIRDAATQEAVQSLYELGAIQSADKFFPGRLVNRAEFLKMAEIAAFPDFTPETPAKNCFADVPSSAWFARWVCQAVQYGGISGYVLPGKPTVFRPAQNVTYAEGLKILLAVYDFGDCSQSGDNPWYRSCLQTADDNGIVMNLDPAAPLNRSQAACLIAMFVARLSPAGVILPSSSSSSAPSSSSSSSASSVHSSSSSASSQSSSAPMDANKDVSIRSQFLVLGDASGPVLGAAKAFLYEEPLDLTAIQVNLDITGPAVDALLVYDQNMRYLGRATSTATTTMLRTYRLEIPNGTVTVPQREERTFYVRPVLMARESGGQSGLITRIHNFTFEGNGVWSSRKYVNASSDTFFDFETARGAITSVKNAGQVQEFLVGGTDRKIGSYAFTARKNDGSAEVKVTMLTFTIEQAGGVTLAHARIGVEGDSTRYDCTVVAGETVTCAGLSDIGVIDDAKTFNLYADVFVPVGANNASLRLTLNQGGSTSEDGAVTWTDGTTSFSWLPTGGGPVAQGTLFKN